MWRNNTIDSELLETIIVPIFKKGDKTQPNNYRPISLLNTFTNLLTSIMTNRLNDWCEKNSKISMFQAAYRKGMGCENHVFVLNSILQSNLQKKEVEYMHFSLISPKRLIPLTIKAMAQTPRNWFKL